MRQVTKAEVVAEVRRHTVGNRAEIEASRYAGCVSCCAVYNSKEVQDWQDEWTSPEKQNRVKRWTAKCPRCGQPKVIGSVTGLLEDQGYLPIVSDVLRRHLAHQQERRRP